MFLSLTVYCIIQLGNLPLPFLSLMLSIFLIFLRYFFVQWFLYPTQYLFIYWFCYLHVDIVILLTLPLIVITSLVIQICIVLSFVYLQLQTEMASHMLWWFWFSSIHCES